MEAIHVINYETYCRMNNLLPDSESADLQYLIDTYTETFRLFITENAKIVFTDEFDAADYMGIDVDIIFEAEDYRDELFMEGRDDEAMAVRIEIENQRYDFCWE